MVRKLTEKEKSKLEIFHGEIISRLGELKSFTECGEFTETEKKHIFGALENINEKLGDIENILEDKENG